MQLSPYREQVKTWPSTGRHVMAQFDVESIYVYQAYRPSIAVYAITHQRFGGDFSFDRMSWIKPNFLWMMYRSGWATKDGQERILAIRLKREFFDQLLATAVASSFAASGMDTHEAWRAAVANSDVRLQWDPDHDPAGRSVERRAVQLGLRGAALLRYGTDAVFSIDDITPLVEIQRANAIGDFSNLMTPREQPYPIGPSP